MVTGQKRLKMLTEKNKKEALLRLEVVPAGCSGFSYKFALIDNGDVKNDDKYVTSLLITWNVRVIDYI